MKEKRNYKVRFNINIGEGEDKKTYNYIHHYLKKWSQFYRQLNQFKLASIPNNGTTSVKELPKLRDYLKVHNVNTEDIIELLMVKRSDLARMLLETAPLFDMAPLALKAHILAVFGVTYLELQKLN